MYVSVEAFGTGGLGHESDLVLIMLLWISGHVGTKRSTLTVLNWHSNRSPQIHGQ